MSQNKIYIGTSGFDYPEWKGIIYPENLKRKDFLACYSIVFNALEINSTFYCMPTKEQMLSFHERSEGRLKFSIKANILLTHEITSEWKDVAIEFQKRVGVLNDKGVLGTILFQFPPTFNYTVENRKYLAELLQEFSSFNSVVEFRNSSWVRKSVFEGLAKRNVSIVFIDMPQLCRRTDGSFTTQFIGPNAYVRFHQKNNSAWYCRNQEPFYTPDELTLFFPVIKQAIKENRDTYLFFYNHSAGTGALAAQILAKMTLT